jgi:hypothetical protein
MLNLDAYDWSRALKKCKINKIAKEQVQDDREIEQLLAINVKL